MRVLARAALQQTELRHAAGSNLGAALERQAGVGLSGADVIRRSETTKRWMKKMGQEERAETCSAATPTAGKRRKRTNELHTTYLPRLTTSPSS